MNKIWSYDIEIFPNYATFMFIDMEPYLEMYNGIRGKDGNLIVTEQEKINRIKAIPHTLFEISSIEGHERCDILALLDFINQDDYLCGFNSKSFDNVILNMLAMEVFKFKDTKDINTKLKALNDKLIHTDPQILRQDAKVNLYKWLKVNYKTIDVQKIPALDKVFKSLKQTLINLSWFSINDFQLPPIDEETEGKYYKVTPAYYKYIKPWDRYLMKHHVEDLVEYNRNDVLGVCEMFDFLKERILLRFSLNDKYGVDTLSASDSNICDIIISKYYSEGTGLEYKEFKDLRTHRSRMKIGKIISPLVKFETVAFNELLHKLLNTTISSTNDIDYPVTFDGITYDIKSGGLHSRDIPGSFISSAVKLLKDFDWASYYPNLILLLRAAPKHLDKEVVLANILVIITQRLEAKAMGNKVDADSLKITINTFFGKTNFAFSFLFDTLVTITTTINGQLLLLMLIEKLALIGIKTLSANTDGIVCDIPIDKLDIYEKTCNDFAEYIGIGGEYTDYIKYFRLDVNNYITVKQVHHDPKKHKSFKGFDKEDKHGKYYLDVKRKGRLNQNLCTEDLKKGFNKPIVAKAVEEYLINGVPVAETIANERNIYLFCVTQNMDAKFTPTFRTTKGGIFKEETLQKNIRFYISNSGGILLKKSGEGGAAEYSNVVAGLYTTIFNDYFEVDDFNEYDINHMYYILEAKKLVTTIESGIKGKRKKDKNAQSNRFVGNLFSDADFDDPENARKDESLKICADEHLAIVPSTNLQEELPVEVDTAQFERNIGGEFEPNDWDNKPLTEDEVAMLNEANEDQRLSSTSSPTGDLEETDEAQQFNDDSDDLPF